MSDPLDDSFRDSISTIDQSGKRAWLFPKKPSGKWYNRRKALSYGLLAFLFAAPFVRINGHPLLLFNVLDRKFSLFGFPFFPQDFHIFVIIMIIGVVSLALFTVAFGRIFCGWFCPQTIFMEMLFRRVEYWIDGDRNAQIRLDKQAWDAEKIRKRLSKWFLFYLISFGIANVFLAYIIGSERLVQLIEDGPSAHLSTLVALLIFTYVFYFIYSWFREQVCIIACPYGRLQGVLLDAKSVIVAYDHKRGERDKGRAKWHKNEDRAQTGKGDCIDCAACVHVCPTGIDIRNGTQLECTNCTACIDECDSIMRKVGLPTGLIRYASENEIEKQEPFKFTPRMKGYVAVLVVLFGVFVSMLFIRGSIEATVLHLPGQLFQHNGAMVTNVYTYKIVNKTNDDLKDVRIVLRSPKGTLRLVGQSHIVVKTQEMAEGTLFIDINEALLEGEKTELTLDFYNGNHKIDSGHTNFLGPRSFD